jgi:hypothetical protein
MKCNKIELLNNREIKTIIREDSQIANRNYNGEDSTCICPLTFLDHLLRQQEKYSDS